MSDELTPEQQEVNKRSTDPAEMAAMMYSLYLPKYYALLNRMSKKQLLRHIVALLEQGVIGDIALNTQVEKDAYAMGDRLLISKAMMVLDTMTQAYEQSQLAKEVETQKEEIQNG